MALESVARELDLSFERFPVAAGQVVLLGAGWRFDDYAEALRFLFPCRRGPSWEKPCRDAPVADSHSSERSPRVARPLPGGANPILETVR